jgi:hypothetical protein
VAEKIEPTACDGLLPKANSNTQPGLISPPPSQSQALTEHDPFEDAVCAGAIAALRRRARRQRAISDSWTVRAARGVIVRSGEAAVALRISAALDQAADEIEAEVRR